MKPILSRLSRRGRELPGGAEAASPTRSAAWSRGGVCKACGRQTATLVALTCPDCGGPVGAPPVARLRWFSLPALRYQGAYLLFVVISAVDLVLTGVVLSLGGMEVNPVAAAVLGTFGWTGLTAFKFALVLFVVVMCEWIGRRDDRKGTKIAEWSVAITAIPVVIAGIQLYRHFL